DADPLTDEQIALVKRWVALGAKLDAGVDPEEILIRIMPKQPQPPAPDAYNVTIPISAVAISPDGSLLATSGYHEVLLWNTADGKLIRRIGNIAERVSDLEFHPDGDRLAIAAGTPGQMGEALIVKTSDGTVVAELVTTEDAMFAATFSPDGTRLAACGADRAIRLFDVASGKEQTVIEDHADWVMDIAWSPDGAKIASASRDKTSKVFDAHTGDALTTFNKHGEVVFGVAFLPDGATVATSGRDKTIRLWTAEKGDQTREIGGFGSDVFKIAALPDGRLVSCSADKTVRLHTSADGKEVRKFEGHSDWVYAVAAHPASTRLVSGSYDGEIRLWNLDTGEAVLTFKAAPGLEQVAAGTSP
ncbi:MAG: WD40 repeat domain-containing protein, partial [Planctomycetaceae bacterium]